MPWRRKLSLKKKLKSSFQHLSLYFHFWSKVKVSSEAKLLRRTIGFQLSILHRFFTWTTMSQQPFQCHFAEWRVFCLATKLAQSSEFSTPKATWWLHQLASFPLTKSGWGVNVSYLGRWPFVLGFGVLIKSLMLEVLQRIRALISAAWMKH